MTGHVMKIMNFTIKYKNVLHAKMKTVKGAFCKFKLGNYPSEELKSELRLKNKKILPFFRSKEILSETGFILKI